MLAFESIVRPLHFLHLIAGLSSVASCVHLLTRLSSRRHDPRIRTHALVLGVAYLSTYLLGAVIYPTFRVRVRADLLDRHYPWATGLFEIKEHAASIVLVPVLAIVILSRVLDPRQEHDRRHMLLLRGLTGLVLVVLLYNASAGWYLGTIRSV
ncbi:MAG: hypothetical protein HYZ29_19340 [Myxococcales bacterium]|nr:hypothetical protein [Myxococcales bacterium]